MSSQHDNWRQFNAEQEARERCGENQHRFNAWGYCQDCGEEASLPPERDDPYDQHLGN